MKMRFVFSVALLSLAFMTLTGFTAPSAEEWAELSENAPTGPRSGPSILIGHNLSPTSYTLKKGACTVGIYVIGCGLTNDLTLATNPWLVHSYNMYSVILRARGDITEHRAWSLQTAYFKTDRFYPDIYQMEAAGAALTLKQDLAAFYTVNAVVNYMYFFDETIPFSLRREPHNDDAWQVSVTLLQELRMPYGLGLMGEFGVLGANYVYPQLHIGASMSYRTKWSLIQLGVSQTSTLSSLQSIYTQRQGRTSSNDIGGFDFSVHPEIQVQFFF